MTANSPSPVPKRAVVIELLRSAALLVTLLLTALVFALVGSRVLAAFVVAVVVAVFLGGVVPHPRQLRAARRPDEVVEVEVKPWERGRQVWASLTPLGPEGLCVPLRSAVQARRLAPGPFPARVAGRVRPGGRVVIQVGQLTFWPSGPVRDGLPAGAVSVRPRSEEPRRPRRIG